MYGVEHYYYSDDSSTYEIFESIEDAYNYCNSSKWTDDNIPMFIFKAIFNLDLIYKEEDGIWNYDDYVDTIVGNYEIIKILNKIFI